MKIDVLGTEYKIQENIELIKRGVDGLCSGYGKTIEIRPVNSMLDDDSTEEEKTKRYKRVMRHELFHAFFDESGLEGYSENEQLIEWLAIQFPKINAAFEQAGCND